MVNLGADVRIKRVAVPTPTTHPTQPVGNLTLGIEEARRWVVQPNPFSDG